MAVEVLPLQLLTTELITPEALVVEITDLLVVPREDLV